MILEDITSGRGFDFKLETADLNGDSIRTIYAYCKVVDGNEWLRLAIIQAKEEIKSDYQIFIEESKEKLKQMRVELKKKPLKYFINKIWQPT